MQKVIAKINVDAIRQNATLLKKRANAKLCAVVKANAYGHGAEEVACALSGVADCFAVALIEEGIALRAAACGADILVLTPPTDEEECYALATGGFLASVPDIATAKGVLDVCRRHGVVGRVHLKVNTGMNRYGMDGKELREVCALFLGEPFVKVEGIYSHLYTTNQEISEGQRKRFIEFLEIASGYFSNLTAHLSATYGCMLGEEFSFDMVRVGIGLYGYSPIPTDITLRRAMSVWAKTVATRTYGLGGAGYGELALQKGTPLTLLRVGYADGFLRRKENGAEGAESNANDLCMDGCIRFGEGRTGEWSPILLDAEKTARAANTIPYEVLCAATRRATFIYE